MTVNRNPELFLSLPAKAQADLRERSDYAAITQEIEDLSLKMSAAKTQATISELKSRRNQLFERRRKLEKEELDRVRAGQDRIHPSEREGPFHIDQHRSMFDRVRHLMEERSRLSNTLFCVALLRSTEGTSAVEDLTALLKNSCRVAYQPLFRPRHGRCPVAGCDLELEK
jgi:HSP90 family molecular chaperone